MRFLRALSAISASLLILLLVERDESQPLIRRALCNQINSIHYDQRNNFDHYSAHPHPNAYDDKWPANAPNGRQTRKSSPPARQPVAGLNNLTTLLQQQQRQAPTSDEQVAPDSEQGGLPPVRGQFQHRQAKKVAGFGRDAESAETPSRTDQDVRHEEADDRQRPAAAPVVASSSDRKEAEEQVCLTPGCVKAAADILKNIDDRVDPCDDFYRYSCGNWIDSQVIPEDKTSVSLFSVVQDELDNKLRNLIEREPKASESPIVQKMRNLYESCMNTSEYREIGRESSPPIGRSC
jgi:hypothetical protein